MSAGRPRLKEDEKKKPLDRIVCNICNITYTRAHKSVHDKSKRHLIYKNMNDDVRRVINYNKKNKKREDKIITIQDLKYNGSVKRILEEFDPNKI